jgi:hypothetical protein
MAINSHHPINNAVPIRNPRMLFMSKVLFVHCFLRRSAISSGAASMAVLASAATGLENLEHRNSGRCEPAVGGRVIIALSHYSRSYREWWSETVPCFRPRYRLACKKWSVAIKNASKSGCCARLDPRAGFTRPLRFVCGQRNCACGRGGSWVPLAVVPQCHRRAVA